MVGLFVTAAISQVKLQTREKDLTKALAEKTERYDHKFKDYALRGSIVTADGKPLAEDEESSRLMIIFDHVPKSEGFYMAMSEASGIPACEFAAIGAIPHAQRTWRQPMNAAQTEAIEQVRQEWRADGVSVDHSSHRRYPFAEEASCVVGVMRGAKKFGLEGSQDNLLTGTDGVRQGMTDRKGLFLPLRMTSAEKPKADGKNLTLTLDSDLQAVAAREVRKAVEVNAADNGVALVMDPMNGDVLAMANWPSFTPYQPDGTDASLNVKGAGFNPNFQAQLEPGSMFKILTLAKALDEGKTTLNEVIDCTGEYHPTTKTRIRCDSHHGNRAHGPLTASGAIEKSCNVSAAIWAERIGYDPFLQYVRDLGLLRPSTLGLPHELHGSYNYKDQEPGHRLQLATFGFGQSITCTPVSLLGAFSVIANRGMRVEPRLIKRIGSEDLPVAAPQPLIRPDSAEKVLSCMEEVIEGAHGTGRSLQIPGYRLAGKTGTAQKVGKKQSGYVSNFVGMVPAQSPRAVILVMVNHPTNGKVYGADVAGPVFKELARAVIRHFKIAPTEAVTSPNRSGALALR